ncbi:3-deoxy-manno-octulosonate cytidylyltransferase [uncultured Mesonia sp.]|uniref:3-deoxy-manno-octulosonate cytidylyltransferase n=1 Tax=uncultured Mesonia sp. TaxID=399731 RepID=UPI00374E8391
MKVIAMIPARYDASRFPGKLMQDLCGASVILRTYQATCNTNLFDDVIVVTDSDIIFNEITTNGGKAFKSIKDHACGSDRIAEAVAHIDADIVVNVQGDEPFTSSSILAALLEVFKNDSRQEVDLASLMTPLHDKQDIENSNNVKVIVDREQKALYFSRSVIPFVRDEDKKITHYKHIGIYAFRKQALLDFAKLPMLDLEAAEKIECLRYLEYGKTIKMVITDKPVIGIDIPEDLEKARKKWAN